MVIVWITTTIATLWEMTRFCHGWLNYLTIASLYRKPCVRRDIVCSIMLLFKLCYISTPVNHWLRFVEKTLHNVRKKVWKLSFCVCLNHVFASSDCQMKTWLFSFTAFIIVTITRSHVGDTDQPFDGTAKWTSNGHRSKWTSHRWLSCTNREIA